MNNLKEQVEEVILTNIENIDFSIDDLCKEIGISRSQLHRRLKVETNLSTSLLIRKIKLQKGRQLIIDTSFNISEICYKAGFSSPQNFTKYFKVAYGVSPTKYRQQLIFENKETSNPLTNTILPAPKAELPKPPPISKQISSAKNHYLIPIILAGLASLALFSTFLLFQKNQLPNNETDLEQSEVPMSYKPEIKAYNAFLRGNHLIKDRSLVGLKKGIEEFDLALTLDSNYTAAYLAKATAIHLLGGKINNDKAESMVLEIIRKEKRNGKAYALLANIYSDQHKLLKSLTFMEIALDLLPNDPMINYWYSLRLRSIGELEGAMKYGKIAADLAPLHPLINAGYIYSVICARELNLAEELIAKSDKIFRGSHLFLYIKGSLEIHKMNFEKALGYTEASLAIDKDFDLSNIAKAYCLVKLDRMEEVESYLANLDPKSVKNTIAFSIIYGSMNELDKGIEYLNKGVAADYYSSDILIGLFFEPYHNYPKYQEILNKVGLLKLSKQYAAKK